jgi:uncharacterized membrane protein YfcA
VTPLPPAIFAAALVVVLVTSTVQGTLGFGANLLAMPILVQLDPMLVPGPAIVPTVVLSVSILLRNRRSVHLDPVANALVGRAAGTGVGVAALAVLSDRGIGLVVALVVLAAVAAIAAEVSAPRTRANMITAGLLSGFGGTTAGIGGPPVALMFADTSGPEVRGSMSAFFIVGSAMTFVGLRLADRFGLTEIWLGLTLIPAALVGFRLSGPLGGVVDRGYTRPAILTLSSLAAVVLLTRLALS